jgi:hypothetical protein
MYAIYTLYVTLLEGDEGGGEEIVPDVKAMVVIIVRVWPINFAFIFRAWGPQKEFHQRHRHVGKRNRGAH